MERLAGMGLLREYSNVRQIPGESLRRWFSCLGMELILWEDAGQAMVGFQLCYDTDAGQKALTWRLKRGFAHDQIDDGENGVPRLKMMPVLIADQSCPSVELSRRFAEAARDLESELVEAILLKIEEFAEGGT